MTDVPAPGWYPDSSSPGLLRWWDGRHWTDQTFAEEYLYPQAPAVEVVAPQDERDAIDVELPASEDSLLGTYDSSLEMIKDQVPKGTEFTTEDGRRAVVLIDDSSEDDINARLVMWLALGTALVSIVILILATIMTGVGNDVGSIPSRFTYGCPLALLGIFMVTAFFSAGKSGSGRNASYLQHGRFAFMFASPIWRWFAVAVSTYALAFSSAALQEYEAALSHKSHLVSTGNQTVLTILPVLAAVMLAVTVVLIFATEMWKMRVRSEEFITAFGTFLLAIYIAQPWSKSLKIGSQWLYGYQVVVAAEIILFAVAVLATTAGHSLRSTVQRRLIFWTSLSSVVVLALAGLFIGHTISVPTH